MLSDYLQTTLGVLPLYSKLVSPSLPLLFFFLLFILSINGLE